ncbi:aminoglycoside adenylyltransferase domain-containing protein [Exiguobacterium sp. s22]|uniref:aminoglycoside adenylyltransferase domain-containing protein n=1 Tax=Exiguobacterium sp. s22 TaxID=2751272 RepID=UPI001BEC10A5|nr:aminoglycoside adenylyltransferase domain-containing protein [Exiguobacterium sp. s22]
MRQLPTDVENTIASFVRAIDEFLPTVQHIYIHGSVAMGGFHPKRSDVDLLLVVSNALTREERHKLIDCCLLYSNEPYPLELSIMTVAQLKDWCHPSPFEFHYSEGWRSRFEKANGEERTELQQGFTDPDLAAHMLMILERGITWRGHPLHQLLCGFDSAHFSDAIRADAIDCLDTLEENPIYCVLNLVRGLAYEQERVLLSKQEALGWLEDNGHFPGNVVTVVRKASQGCKGEGVTFDQYELNDVRQYMNEQLQLKQK